MPATQRTRAPSGERTRRKCANLSSRPPGNEAGFASASGRMTAGFDTYALWIQREANRGRSNSSSKCCASLVEPVLVLEFFRQVTLGQILKVFVGQGIKLILKTDGEHAFDFILPLFFLKPFVLHQLFGAVDIFVVQLDADIARYSSAIRIGAREADEFRFRNRHALAFECQIDRSLLDHRIDIIAP